MLLFMIEIAGFLLFLSVFLFFQKKFGKTASSYMSIGIVTAILLIIVLTGNVDETSRYVIVFGIIALTGMIYNLRREKNH